jgi:uncharacterized protein (DUF302 family)
MEYFFAKTLKMDFDEAIEKVTNELKKDGFGVLTDIDVQATMKKKIDKDMDKYRILGACNPNLAFEAIQAENQIGVFLPCNVIVRETTNGEVEIAAVSPKASMMSVENDALGGVAMDVEEKLKGVIARLN